MPPVGHLYRFGEGLADRVAVAGAVPADVCGPGMLAQPGDLGLGGAIGQDVDPLAGLGVGDHGGVVVPAREGEVIDAEPRGTRGGGVAWRVSMRRAVEREIAQASARAGRAPARPANSLTTEPSWLARRLVRRW